MLYQAVPKNDVPEILGQLSKEFFTPPPRSHLPPAPKNEATIYYNASCLNGHKRERMGTNGNDMDQIGTNGHKRAQMGTNGHKWERFGSNGHDSNCTILET